MKKSLFVPLVLLLNLSTYGQSSFSVFNHISNFDEIENVLSSPNQSREPILRKGIGFSFGNLIRLNKVRLAFHPNLSVTVLKKYRTDYTDFFLTGDNNGLELSMLQSSFGCETRLYPSNFRKQKPQTEKPTDWKYFMNCLFVNFSPGFTIIQQKAVYGNNIFPPETLRKLYFRTGIGAGFDVRINRYLTIAPSVTWNRIRNMSTEGFNVLVSPSCSGCPSFASYAFSEEIEYDHFNYGLTFFVSL